LNTDLSRYVLEVLRNDEEFVLYRGWKPELVLVSGYSGIGKSAVVNELHKSLVSPRGLFASGKFDQYKRDIPYSTLAQAFQGLIRLLLGKNEGEFRPQLPLPGAFPKESAALCTALASAFTAERRLGAIYGGHW
jgi:hypothetical protein